MIKGSSKQLQSWWFLLLHSLPHCTRIVLFLCSFCISLASFPPPDTNCSSCVKYDMAIKQFSILNLITLVGFCFCMSQFRYSCTVFLGAWASSGINHQFRITKNTQIHMCTHTHTHTHTHTDLFLYHCKLHFLIHVFHLILLITQPPLPHTY